MFDPDEAFRIIGEPFEGLTRAEIEERLALSRELTAWVQDLQARAFARVAVLEAAGIEVVVGVEQARCARRILGFARPVGFGLPEVTLKAGISADGRIATSPSSSDSRRISSSLTRSS